MKIHLSEEDIVKGIALYLSSTGINLHGKDLATTFKAGRGHRGVSVDVVVSTSAFVVEANDAKPSLTLVKDEPDAMVSGTPSISDNVGNEAQVSVEVTTEEKPKNPVSLFN